MRAAILWFAALSFAALPASAQDRPSPSGARLAEALAAFAHEPTALDLVEAALALRTATPGRVRDAIDRARATGWLPTARAGIRRGQAVDLRGVDSSATPTNVSTDDDLVLEATLTFRFDRIAFAPEEPALMRELRAVEAEQAVLAQTVVALYYERRRLQLELALVAPGDLARTVRVLELTATLDALTGGALSRSAGTPDG